MIGTPYLARVTHANTFFACAPSLHFCVISQKSHPRRRVSCRTCNVHGLNVFLFLFRAVLRLTLSSEWEYLLQSATRSSVWSSCGTEPDYASCHCRFRPTSRVPCAWRKFRLNGEQFDGHVLAEEAVGRKQLRIAMALLEADASRGRRKKEIRAAIVRTAAGAGS